MKLIAIEYWALWVACILLLVSCLINVRNTSMAVPNWLSLPSILIGWLAALTLTTTSILPAAGGGLLSSIGAAMIGPLSLMPLYAIGVLGAGSVKMQMGFGAWVGGALPFGKAALLLGVGGLVCLGICFGIAVVFMSRKTSDLPNEDVAPKRRLIPAQPVLAVGSIGTTLVLSMTGLL
jgi:Flp pilus assembly protein protease CpaA